MLILGAYLTFEHVYSPDPFIFCGLADIFVFFSVNFLIPCCPGAMGDFPELRYCRFGSFVSMLFCCKVLSCGGAECACPFPAQISPESELGALFQLVFHRLMTKYCFCKVWRVWREFWYVLSLLCLHDVLQQYLSLLCYRFFVGA